MTRSVYASTAAITMHRILRDLRYAVRYLRRKPGFTVAAVGALALGIGANTAIFSVVTSVLLRPLPYADADRVVAVWNSLSHVGEVTISVQELLDYREEIASFEEMAAYSRTHVNLLGDGVPERVPAAHVTANLFAALGTEPLLGRGFAPAEERAGSGSVAVIGHDLWQRRFGGDPGVVGSTVRIDGAPRTVVGIMPADFRLPADLAAGRVSEVWTPLAVDPDSPGNRGSRFLTGIARLGQDATLSQANAELDLLARRWRSEGVATDPQFSVFARTLRSDLTGEVRGPLMILLGAVALVLLIACANVANLLLARGDERRREIAVRAAMGAGRRTIAGQLMVESLLLASIGAVVGLGLGLAGVRAFLVIEPGGLPQMGAVGLDWTVLAFTAAVALLAGVVFGLAPALQAARRDLTEVLRAGGRGSIGEGGRQAFRRGLVVSQIALAVVLVIGAALMIRSFAELSGVRLGFDPGDVVTMSLSLPAAEYPDADPMAAFYAGLVERVEALPGVRAAGATARLPLVHQSGDWGIDIAGRERPPEGGVYGYFQIVTPGYFESLRIPVVRGRTILGSDRADASPVVVVNESMARVHWPGEEAIGQRIRLRTGDDDAPWFTVAGVVADIRHNAVGDPPLHEMYFPHAQLPLALGGTVPAMHLVARTTGDPMAAVGPIRDAVRSIDPAIPVSDVRTMEALVREALAEPRFTMLLLGVFAAVALLLGSLGIYAVIAYTVSRRAQEIGVRIALGARMADVLRLVLRQGIAMAAIGIGSGLILAVLLARTLTGLLYGVSPLDPATFLLVPLLLGAVAVAAAYLPARRAARLDPMRALRME